MIRLLFIVSAFLFLSSCKKNYEAPVPTNNWDLFNSPSATSLTNLTREKLEGVYTISDGADAFGTDAVVKCSYTIEKTDTIYHISMFCERQVIYIICEGKRLDSSILLNGYWRNMLNTETGIARFTITPGNASYLLDSSTITNNLTVITGTVGDGAELPSRPLTLQFNRPLYKATPFEIIAHRGGGRTSDLLPASENTVEVIKMAARFGSTGIEIDVRYTKDGIPVLYHDADLNERLIQRNGMLGPIENYTSAQLRGLVRLTNGERIPTLREALDAAIYKTPIQFIWLDTKFIGDMNELRNIQEEYMQKAAAAGRTVEIKIGIPDEKVQANFVQLQGFRNIPSINELTLADLSKTGSDIWAPRWTLGLQTPEVNLVKSQGKKAFVWTLDVPENIKSYFENGRFDGILSNYPSSVAYYYYAKK